MIFWGFLGNFLVYELKCTRGYICTRRLSSFRISQAELKEYIRTDAKLEQVHWRPVWQWSENNGCGEGGEEIYHCDPPLAVGPIAVLDPGAGEYQEDNYEICIDEGIYEDLPMLDPTCRKIPATPTPFHCPPPAGFPKPAPHINCHSACLASPTPHAKYNLSIAKPNLPSF